MDSNFSVKITADISELQSRLAAVEAITGKFKQSMDKAADSVKNMEQNANRGRMVAFAFGQVIRDAGFFSSSFSLGILAISNNIPILIDQLALSVKVLQPFAGALSLVGSLLTAGLTIWAYSTQQVNKNKKSLEEWKSSLDDITESQLRGKQAATEELTKLDFLYKASTNVANGVKTRISAAKQLQDLYPSIFGNYSTEEIMLGKVSGAYNTLRVNILETAKAQARFDKIVENSNKILDNQERVKQIQIELNNIEAKVTTDVVKRINALNESYRRKGSSYQVGIDGVKRIIQSHLAENDVYQSLNAELQDLNKNTQQLNNSNKDLEAQTGGNVAATQALVQGMSGYKTAQDKVNKSTKESLELEANKFAIRLRNIKIAQDAREATEAEALAIQTLNDEMARGLYELDPIYQQAIANAKALAETQKAQTDSVTALSRAVGGELVNSFMTMMETGSFSFASIAQAIGKMIKRLIAAIAAAAILSAILGSIFPSAKNTGFADIMKIITGINLVPNAKGGIYSGPTPALVGEYPGARSNPEVIAPLDRLQSIMGNMGGSNGQMGAVIAETRLSGNDLAILIKRADRNRNGNY